MTHDNVESTKIPTILIVEDDLLLLKAYGIKFKKEGWNTVLLSDGAAAMAYLRQIPPDAVLLDLMLTAPSGFEILEAMRKNVQWKNAPVFVLTNLSREEDCVRAEKLGAIKCVVKANNGIDDIIEKICTETRARKRLG